ncbi:endonuclease/exonuclease/phosphatase (EEP) superfamily protein YafD [Salegentibacter sp. 24]|uniref:endonuclease/exonuclease/phosphatase family protein n=1 Tax=Salegentibacter sp. 24 TaxID=2183986 RepID=UPI0010620BF2|nr:endonuclease/exonuclease/phosphatase family protein [Salegentibacter sp. 24]TDN95320.1 endonuclease/exonuclease/phosphatase (EEP) superfamily protein YafD [Salegentibacter sp. 24]
MKKFLYYLLVFIGLITILISLGSLISNERIWWVKILDFPRIQVLILSSMVLVLFFILKRGFGSKDLNRGQWIFILGIITSIVIQVKYLYPYTNLGEKRLKSISLAEAPEGSTFDLLVANVYLHNKKVQELIDIIDDREPDIILLMETDQWWENALQSIDDKYSYGMEYPLNNTYGMILYSKFPLFNQQIKFLTYDNVPSFHTLIELPSGKIFKFHGVHPVPPYPGEPNTTNDKEVALVKIGKMVEKTDMPGVVAGDFNDVAWTREDLFKQDDLLEDVRIGRGIYNTYSAKSIFKRWPLDYVFTTEHFAVVDILRLRDIGSDHFPLYASLSLIGE